VLLLLFFQHANAQLRKYVIHLRDKANTVFSLQDPSPFLSAKSIQRRTRQQISIDSTDLPVIAAYLDSIRNVPSVHIQNWSKWLNQVLISISDSAALNKINQFPFVLSYEPVNNLIQRRMPDQVSINQHEQGLVTMGVQQASQAASTDTDYYNYGASLNQILIHHGDFLHNLGFHGEGMTIAILDDGFNSYLSNPAFDSVRNSHRILGTYDYVNEKVSVNEEDGHGANCFSIIASNMPGTMVGTAPNASFWLFKTEDITSETPVEEQNWIAAAEFADSVGADLISTSLGYDYFDDSAYNLSYADRNGHTSMISRAANLAVAKGMIVTVSAGNAGEDVSEMKFVICPADGDSVYAVGAIDASGNIAPFSSWGPNSSGQVKPDGVSVGLDAAIVSSDGTPYYSSGTSFSNPNLAGLITCLWQAFPEFNAHDITAAVRQTSSKYTDPDDRFGYGIPDFEKAYQLLTNKRLNQYNQILENDWIRAFPVPFQQSFTLVFKPNTNGVAYFQLLDISGKLLQSVSAAISANQLQLQAFQNLSALPSGVYLIRYKDASRTKTIKLLK
jgi:hypothetical protein